MSTQSELKILLSCAGLGMGNASRTAAVMESLWDLRQTTAETVHFEVFSWGAGYDFLKAFQVKCEFEFTLTRLESYQRWSVGAFVRNCRQLKKAVHHIQPHLIVLDSDYHFPAFWSSKSPIVSIGQAHDVVERSQHYHFHSFTESMRWFFCEKMDAHVQSFFSNRVLVPSFRNFSKQSNNFTKIPLIVRREFIAQETSAATSSVGVLLSGSQLETAKFLRVAKTHQLKVISPAVATVPARANEIDQFDVVITQGGLSSISECLARGKFMIVVPLKHHPEQILNAREVDRLGLGIVASTEELENLSTLVARAQERRQMARPHISNCHGAEWAARLLIETANGQILPEMDSSSPLICPKI